jgi:hypothetical protein
MYAHTYSHRKEATRSVSIIIYPKIHTHTNIHACIHLFVLKQERSNHACEHYQLPNDTYIHRNIHTNILTQEGSDQAREHHKLPKDFSDSFAAFWIPELVSNVCVCVCFFVCICLNAMCAYIPTYAHTYTGEDTNVTTTLQCL